MGEDQRGGFLARPKTEELKGKGAASIAINNNKYGGNRKKRELRVLEVAAGVCKVCWKVPPIMKPSFLLTLRGRLSSE